MLPYRRMVRSGQGLNDETSQPGIAKNLLNRRYGGYRPCGATRASSDRCHGRILLLALASTAGCRVHRSCRSRCAHLFAHPQRHAFLPGLYRFHFDARLRSRDHQYSVYDNNRKIFESNGGTGNTLGDGDGTNGLHHVVINAWDSSGKLYQASVSFRVIGNGFPAACPVPFSPGINFCVPTPGAVLGTNYPAVASAKGQSGIAAMRLYVDGKDEGTLFNVNTFSAGEGGSVGTQGDQNPASKCSCIGNILPVLNARSRLLPGHLPALRA